MTERILFVDDDGRVLDGLKRMLHGEFDVETALSGTEGLATIHLFGPFAVVISDMRMPVLDGAEFLARVRELSPQTVRMLLTGYKDLSCAIAAVNEGQIFRYLTKPCSKEEMVSAIRLGLAQYRDNVKAAEIIKEARERSLNSAGQISQEILLVKE
ncbi:MAG: response regulator [Terracidiphilus sp.]